MTEKEAPGAVHDHRVIRISPVPVTEEHDGVKTTRTMALVQMRHATHLLDEHALAVLVDEARLALQELHWAQAANDPFGVAMSPTGLYHLTEGRAATHTLCHRPLGWEPLWKHRPIAPGDDFERIETDRRWCHFCVAAYRRARRHASSGAKDATTVAPA